MHPAVEGLSRIAFWGLRTCHHFNSFLWHFVCSLETNRATRYSSLWVTVT